VINCLSAAREIAAAPEPAFFAFAPHQGRETVGAGYRFLAGSVLGLIVFQGAGALAGGVSGARKKRTELALPFNHRCPAFRAMNGGAWCLCIRQTRSGRLRHESADFILEGFQKRSGVLFTTANAFESGLPDSGTIRRTNGFR